MNENNPTISNKPTSPFGIFCWCFFDWAHSAFPTVIISFVFATYFTESVADSTILGTAYWGWTMGLSGILVGILSPIFGSIADYTGKRKPWLAIFILGNVITTALLFFTQPSPQWVLWALIFVVLASVFYELTQVFYNAMMISISPKEKIGRISGWGWGLGYIGGLVCLVIALFLFVDGNWFPKTMSLNIRSTTLLVAGWFLIFAIPLFVFTPDVSPTGSSLSSACKKGLKELWHTLKSIREYKAVFMFLLAHLIYIDGLSTLFVFGAIFAAGTFHMTYMQILIYAILLNLTAGIGAAIFAFVDDYIGPKFVVCISLIAMIITGTIILFSHSIVWFWILSAILGIFVGPTQAASRSYMARLTPSHLTNQMFGIYQFSGRITSFVGPILVGTITEIFKSQRLGMSVIFIMMFVGLLILFATPKPSQMQKTG